jgi:hypothetical protein
MIHRQRLFWGVIAGLDPAIHPFGEKMDHRVTPLRAGPVMTVLE